MRVAELEMAYGDLGNMFQDSHHPIFLSNTEQKSDPIGPIGRIEFNIKCRRIQFATLRV